MNHKSSLSCEIVHSGACILLLQPHKRPGIMQENATKDRRIVERDL